MIVRDGAAGLARCLASVAGVAGRILIGDTGSTDDSIAIARHYGAEVVSVPWEDDFSKARNAVLAQARCDWVLVLDADEMLDPSAAAALPALLAREDVYGYDLWRWNYVRESYNRSGEHGALPNPVLVEDARPYPAYVRTLNTRLFRRHAEIRFDYPVHEAVADRMDRTGLRREGTDLVIHHFGHVEDAEPVRNRKNELYQQLGRKKIEANPTDARAWFEVGLGELEHLRRPEQALPYFLRAEALGRGDATPWLYAGICLGRLQRWPEALHHLERSAALDARSIVLWEALGDTYFGLKDFPRAQRCYEQARALGSVSALVEAKLGAAEVRLGAFAEGVARMQQALKREPAYRELYDILSTGAFLAGNVALAKATAEKRLGFGKVSGYHYLLAATLHTHAGEPARAHRILEDGLALFPGDVELQTAIRTPERS